MDRWMRYSNRDEVGRGGVREGERRGRGRVGIDWKNEDEKIEGNGWSESRQMGYKVELRVKVGCKG